MAYLQRAPGSLHAVTPKAADSESVNALVITNAMSSVTLTCKAVNIVP